VDKHCHKGRELLGTIVELVDLSLLGELLPGLVRSRPSGWPRRAPHLCYVIDALAAWGADVTSLEAARSSVECCPNTRRVSSAGSPCTYNAHSRRVPPTDENAALLRWAAEGCPWDRLWVNPDLGLKTRSQENVAPALAHLVAAAYVIRAELG
jgi:5-methyltetrahydropteroyltriglutamate--homocysteine methyltransferase